MQTNPVFSDLALAADPARLMRAVGLPPDPWQATLLRSRATDTLLLCTRQGGKSTTTAALALHHALYHPPALVLCLSPSLRQSGELFRKIIGFYHRLGDPVPAARQTALTLELTNRSRVLALPGQEATIRGYSGVTLLLIDEAARVDDSLYYAVRPMLAVSGGRLIALSTPFGKRGFFFGEWEHGQGWQRIHATAAQCPRITPAFLAQERRRLGDAWFRQEYECSFRDTMDAVFSHDVVVRALSGEVTPLFG